MSLSNEKISGEIAMTEGSIDGKQKQQEGGLRFQCSVIRRKKK